MNPWLRCRIRWLLPASKVGCFAERNRNSIMNSTKAIEDSLTFLDNLIQSSLDILPHQEYAEKLIYPGRL